MSDNNDSIAETGPLPETTPEVPSVALQTADASTQAGTVQPSIPSTRAHPQAANIATAAELVTGHHSSLEAAGAWLYATAAGVFESAEHAIEHILGKNLKV